MTCEWCGHEHARDALCTSRPKWSRRGFLSLFGAGIAGLAVAPALATSDAARQLRQLHVIPLPAHLQTVDQILKAYYAPVIEAQLERRPRWVVKHGALMGTTLSVHAR